MSGVSFGMIKAVVPGLMGRPAAHVGSVEALDVKHDGIDACRVEVYDAPLCQSGKRKGQPNWRKATNKQTRIFVWADLEAAAAEWSERTGLCTSCMGDGRSLVRWSSTDGTTWKPCPDCNGTGSADGQTPAASRQPSLFEAAQS